MTRLDQFKPDQACIMLCVNVSEAKAQLSKLLERAEAGEEIILARAGRPVARLVQYAPPQPDRVPGVWKDKIWVADDFDHTPEDLIDAFYDASHDESA